MSIKSAFQIPHHVAIRLFIYAPPRCFSAENFGSGGDGFPHSAEKDGNKKWSFPLNFSRGNDEYRKAVSQPGGRILLECPPDSMGFIPDKLFVGLTVLSRKRGDGREVVSRGQLSLAVGPPSDRRPYLSSTIRLIVVCSEPGEGVVRIQGCFDFISICRESRRR